MHPLRRETRESQPLPNKTPNNKRMLLTALALLSLPFIGGAINEGAKAFSNRQAVVYSVPQELSASARISVPMPQARR